MELGARETSANFAAAALRGLAEAGCKSISLGLCGREEVYFAAGSANLGLGLMVTASHNPLDYNGLKLVGSGARAIAGAPQRGAYAAQLVEAHEQVGGCVVAATPVPKSKISQYGVIAPDAFAPRAGPRLTRAAGLIEKPAARGCAKRSRRRGAVYSDTKYHAAAGDGRARPRRGNSTHRRDCGRH